MYNTLFGTCPTLRDYDVNCPHRDVFYRILTRDQELVFSLSGVQKLRIRGISMFAYIQQIELQGTIAGTFESKIFVVQSIRTAYHHPTCMI